MWREMVQASNVNSGRIITALVTRPCTALSATVPQMVRGWFCENRDRVSNRENKTRKACTNSRTNVLSRIVIIMCEVVFHT